MMKTAMGMGCEGNNGANQHIHSPANCPERALNPQFQFIFDNHE